MLNHSRLSSSVLLPHVLPQLIAGSLGGVLVIGWAVLAYDRKRKLREQPRLGTSLCTKA